MVANASCGAAETVPSANGLNAELAPANPVAPEPKQQAGASR
jgi:hypothetical protein